MEQTRNAYIHGKLQEQCTITLQSRRKNDKVKIAVDTEGYYIEGKLRQAINTVTDVKKINRGIIART